MSTIYEEFLCDYSVPADMCSLAVVWYEFHRAVQCSGLQCSAVWATSRFGLLRFVWNVAQLILDSAAILHATQSFTQLFNLKRKVEDQSAVLAVLACGRSTVQQYRCLQAHHRLQREDLLRCRVIYSRQGSHCTFAAITLSGNDWQSVSCKAPARRHDLA